MIRGNTIMAVMDIVTDFLIISFAVALLWRIRITVQQKIGLGLSFCLSLVMIIIAIIRMSGMKFSDGADDFIWLFFWSQQEASIAVTMVSASAFRSLFVAKVLHRDPPSHPQISSFWRMKLARRPARDLHHRDELPQIPRATLTGMRTMIREAHISTYEPMDDEADRFSPPPLERPNATCARDDGRLLSNRALGVAG